MGGLGVTGPGAEAAARAAIVAALASGIPDDPDARSTVVIPAATLTTLLGDNALQLHTWPRLHIAESLDQALRLLEQHTLHRSRILDDHDITSIAELRDTDPHEEPLPPILLIADTPPAGLQMRTQAVLSIGHHLDITALLLGDWPHGTTIRVAPDGTCQPTTGSTEHNRTREQYPRRMPVLDTTATVDLLQTLHDAVGAPPEQPPPADTATPAATSADEDTTPGAAAVPVRLAPDAEVGAGDGTPPPHSPVQVRILGRPAICHPESSQPPPLRSKALELLVYLAVHHPNGATSDQIVNDLFPDARMKHAHTRLHTAVYNLRKVLSHASGSPDTAHIQRANRTYRLDPSTVDVDLWRLNAAIDQASHIDNDGPHYITHLQAACNAVTGGLAEGCDYDDWIETHREATRRHILDVHSALAATVIDTEPRTAAQLLRQAISHDRYNEALHQQLMRAHHHLGDPDAIRDTLRRLTRALDDIDAEPTDTTTALAASLRHDLNQHQPPRRQ